MYPISPRLTGRGPASVELDASNWEVALTPEEGLLLFSPPLFPTLVAPRLSCAMLSFCILPIVSDGNERDAWLKRWKSPRPAIQSDRDQLSQGVLAQAPGRVVVLGEGEGAPGAKT